MIKLIRRYPALLAFGVLTAAFSSPGQTFLVSLFIPSMQETFSMSKTEIAGFYSVATLISALILPWTGRILDRSNLTAFTMGAGVLLATGCVVLNQSQNIVGLFIGFLLIRNLGQGTLTMVSSTTMARVFGHLRGKAIGISNLGYPIGEAAFPFFVQSWILLHGWRSGWLFVGAFVAFFFLPLVFFLLREDPHRKAQADIAKQIEKQKGSLELPKETRHWSVGAMLRDSRFYFLLLPVLITPMYFTALFFYQLSFFEWKGWDVKWIAVGLFTFGSFRGLVSVLAGPLVDRLTARRVFPLNLVPLGIGLFCFWLGAHPAWGMLYFALAGMTMGLAMTAGSALYPELYGTKELGGIKGTLSSLIVLSTAVAAPVMGALLDFEVSMKGIFLGMIVLIVLGTFSAHYACKQGSDKIKLW